MKWLMPARAAVSSREPAPIQIPSATDRTDRTRSVTIRSPPSSVVMVYRCTGAHSSSGVCGGLSLGRVRPPQPLLPVPPRPAAAIAPAATAARAVALGALGCGVGLGHGDQLLGCELAAVVGLLGHEREADAAAVLVHLDHGHAHLVAARKHLLGRCQPAALGQDPADVQQAIDALAQRDER